MYTQEWFTKITQKNFKYVFNMFFLADFWILIRKDYFFPLVLPHLPLPLFLGFVFFSGFEPTWLIRLAL